MTVNIYINKKLFKSIAQTGGYDSIVEINRSIQAANAEVYKNGGVVKIENIK